METTFPRWRLKFLVSALCYLFQLYPAEAFAAWLRCWVELVPDEIIMNNKIVPAVESRHPEAVLQAYQGGSLVAVEPQGSVILYYDEDVTYQLRLYTPETISDVQFVVETTEGAQFIRPSSIACDGTRSHAKGKDGEVTLQLSGEANRVEVWAGWATGHEAVTLTPRLVFQRMGGENRGNAEL